MKDQGRLEAWIGRRNAERPEERCLWWSGAWWDRREFARKVEAAARALSAGGFRPGERVACFLPDCPTVLVLSVLKVM